MGIGEAYENIHFPMNEVLLTNSIKRIAFDEFYRFIYKTNELRKERIVKMEVDNSIDEIIIKEEDLC